MKSCLVPFPIPSPRLLRRSKLALAIAGQLALLMAGPVCLQAQHGHLNAGAARAVQNEPLVWANGADFSTASGYVKTLEFTNSGRYAGYFQQNITLTALPATSANAGPDPQAPALGAFVRARMTCEEAPAGGQFGFWENGATVPTLSLPAGTTAPTLFALSQGDGSPGSDPYGHIHGRRFTASKPGLYKITFQAIDTSTNGASGGPIHTPSAPIAIWFQAGVNVLHVEPDYGEGHVHLRLAPPLDTTWQIEAADSPMANALWSPVGSPVLGTDLLLERIVDGDPGQIRFFRLKRISP